jgi:membrane protein YdbS with pleckstrin-like domain
LAKGQFVAMSSAAMGADLLFVEEAARAGMPWLCVLPFPAEAFFNEGDFPERTAREAAQQKFASAADVETLKIPRKVEDVTDPAWRHAAFAEAGFRCVDEADVVVAVMQKGIPGKPGGTADAVAHARAAKRPLAIVDPETLEVSRENWPDRLGDELTGKLRRLPSGKLSEEDRQTLSLTTSTALAVAEWRSGFARAARKHIPGIRRGMSAVVVLHALATIITASVLLLLPADFNRVRDAMEWSAFFFVLSGFLFLVWMLWKRPQVNAANYRLAAEIGRGILATWCIPDAASEIVRGVPHAFRHVARNFLLHQRLDPDRPRTLEQYSPEEVHKLAVDYIERRITPQINYYSGKGKRAKRLGRALEIGSVILSFTAVVSAGFLAFSHEFRRALWAFAKLAAATAAPVSVSILVIHEVKRREARYHEMQQSLRRYAEGANEVRSISALRDLVADVERMVLSECHEWWVLAKANVAA